jgi:hypothetical protein
MHGIREAQSLAIHREVAERLRADPDAVLAKARANLNRWMRERGDQPSLCEWRAILDHRPVEELVQWLCGDDADAVRLRQSSPFAGVLGPREIWRIKRDHAPART